MAKKKGSRQKPHRRISKKGKPFVAGRGKPKVKKMKPKAACKPTDMSMRERKQIFAEEIESMTKELKQKGRVRVPGLGIMKLQTRKGIKKGTMVFNPGTGKMQPSKGRPAMKRVRFTAMKALKDQVN